MTGSSILHKRAAYHPTHASRSCQVEAIWCRWKLRLTSIASWASSSGSLRAAGMAGVTKALASLAGLILLTALAGAEALDFPVAPPSKSAAESAGLRRVDAAQLSR